MGKTVIFSIKDIVDVIKARQINKFDSRLAVAGDTGDGKSTLFTKIFYRLGHFNPWKHQVYNQEDVIKLLTTQFKGKCFDDEAINTGYKRDWQKKGQQKLIKILTNYRDSFNVYGSALPNFFSLDKDLRDLFFMMIHVVERGIAIIHLPMQGRMYSQDKWDAKNNARIEENWNKRIRKDANFRIPYQQLSTFAGYLYFNAMTDKQEKIYLEVKKAKRAQLYEDDEISTEDSFYEKIYALLIEGKITKQGLIEVSLINQRKFSSVSAQLNLMLTDRGESNTLGHFLSLKEKAASNSSNVQINDLVPAFPLEST